MLQLILDCTKLVLNILPDRRDFLLKTELHARLLCYKLHLKILYLHKNIKEDSGNNMVVEVSPANYLYYQAEFKWTQWTTDIVVPRVPIHRGNIQQQKEECTFGENSNEPGLRLLIWVMKFENTHFATSKILV